MKVKILMLLILFISRGNAQIKIEFSISSSNNKVQVSVINETDQYLVVPLDTSSLRPYYDNICLDVIEYQYPYPTLGLNVLLKENDSIIESSANSEIPHDTIATNIEFKKQDYLRAENNKKIILWQKQMKIESFEKAKINYYIFNHILYLKPKQKLKFKNVFDLDNITNQKYFHSYFPRNKYNKYVVSLYYDIQPCIYEYLTPSQKKNLKKYKFFMGKLESNKIEIRQ